jgi:hypothetical protein
VLCAKEVWVNYRCCHSEGAPAQDWHERLTALLSELDPLEAICSAPAVPVDHVLSRDTHRVKVDAFERLSSSISKELRPIAIKLPMFLESV